MTAGDVTLRLTRAQVRVLHEALALIEADPDWIDMLGGQRAMTTLSNAHTRILGGRPANADPSPGDVRDLRVTGKSANLTFYRETGEQGWGVEVLDSSLRKIDGRWEVEPDYRVRVWALNPDGTYRDGYGKPAVEFRHQPADDHRGALPAETVTELVRKAVAQL